MGIRVPRITIKADYGNDASFGELRPLSIGYGLHQAWIYAAMFGTSSVFGAPDLAGGVNAGAISLAFLVSIVVYSIALLFGAVTNQKFLPFYVSRKTTVGASIAMTFGTLLLVPVIYGQVGIAVHVLSGVITGVGSALLILQWGTAFSRHEQPTIVINTAVAIAVAIAIYALVLHLAPIPLSGVIAAALPLLEMFFLLKETPRSYLEREDRPIFQPLPINRGMFFLKFGVPIALFGIAIGALRQTSVQTILPAATGSEQALAVLASCCALVLVLITLLALNSADGWNRLFRPLVPFVAVVVFFFPVSGMAESSMPGFVLLVGYMSFEAMLWICFGEFSQQYRLSPVFIFGIGRGVQALTSLVGSLMPLFATAWANALPMGSTTIIVILLLVMVVAYALLPNEAEIRKLVLNCPLTRIVADGGFDHFEAATKTMRPADSTVPAVAPMPGQTDAATSDHSANAAPQHDAAQEESSAPSAGNPLAAAANDAAAHVEANAPACDTSQSASADARPSAASNANPSSNGSIWPTEKRGRFKRKCEATANRYLLSQRETEVLFFLAKGHNATSIQEQLFISEGTTKTHIRHIYRKLDVHSQQELIQMVESAEVS
jgi:DNA-binding CsgD family transcriptional regulator